MRRPHRYCPVRMRPVMSWDSMNCRNLWNWTPRPERKMNLYQLQFYAKQFCRLYFNGDVQERYFKTVHRAYGYDIHETLIHQERRADNILFRSMFANSIFAARRMISTGQVVVNNVQIKRPSYALSDGDILQVIPSATKQVYKHLQRPFMKMWGFLPAYLEVSFATLSVVLIRKPIFDEIPHPFPRKMIQDMNGFYYKFS